MMGLTLDKLFVTTGLLVLLHAAYSATQHRTYLRLTEREFDALPADILIQIVFALVTTCYGIVRVVGKFKEIRAAADLDSKTWDNAGNRLSFYTFQHRGRFLFDNEEDYTSGE